MADDTKKNDDSPQAPGVSDPGSTGFDLGGMGMGILDLLRDDDDDSSSSAPTLDLGSMLQVPQETPAAKVTVYIAAPPNYPHCQAFTEVAEGLCMAFAELGVDARLTYDKDDWEGRLIVLGTNMILSVPNLVLPANAILFNLAHIAADAPWLTDQMIQLYSHFKVWDYSNANVALLKASGIDATYVGIGSMRPLRRIPNDMDEDIDVLFYGSVNDRRKQILQALVDRGAVVKTLFGCYGMERDGYIARSKIVLNMHFYEQPMFEVVRLHYLLNNRRFIVSESGANPQVEKALGSGIAFATYDQLVDTCMDYLQKPEERMQFAAMGYQLFRNPSQADLLSPHLADLL